jgi:predicted DNA-binding protein (MmcQ/YjbR family)
LTRDLKGEAFPHIRRQNRSFPNCLVGPTTPMDIEQVHAHCLSFPHVTEVVLWGNDLVFKIGGKMFAVIGLDAKSDHCMSFKCTPEKFAELVERDCIVPAPYVARYHWVALERFNVLTEKELKSLLRTAYDLVFAKLPKKAKAQLEDKSPPQKAAKKRR